MSQQVQPVLVKDPLLMLSDQVKYGVVAGASDISVQLFPSSSSSSSSIVINAQIPSVSTVMSRHVVLGATITLTVSGTVAPDKFLINYPKDTCLAPFPLAQLTSNCTVMINNNTVSNNVNEILDPILRSVAKDEMARWNSSTPTQLDEFGDYEVLNNIEDTASPFHGFGSYYDYANVPRGSFPLTITGNTLNDTDEPVVKTVTISFTVREPCFVSPFLFSQPAEKAGLTGVSQVIFNMQMDATARRVIRFLDRGAATTRTVTAVAYSDVYAEFKFLSPKSSDLVPATTVCDLMQYTPLSLPTNLGSLTAGSTATYTSNAIMLNSYPDLAIVYVRESQGNLTPYDADAYATIESISVTLDNRSGLMSTFSPVQLFRASTEGGSQQNFYSFSGKAAGWFLDESEPNGAVVATSGTVLNLPFGVGALSIPQDYYSSGSLTTTQFQVRVNVKNNLGYTIVNPQLSIVFVNSGIIVNTNGSTSSYCNGILTKEMVINTIQSQEPVNKYEITRYMGGSIFSNIKSMASHFLPVAKTALSYVKHPAAEVATKALSALGYGISGGAVSGGAIAEGRKGLRHRMM